tara:strand:- start:76 stop:1176 length:1101 start_codon:yes stop_codon:yes gene_type:complete
MNIAFYVDEMNYRGIATSTFLFAYYNKKILKNNSIIFFNNRNKANKEIVINKFKKNFKVLGVTHFGKIDEFKKKYDLKFIYLQKSSQQKQLISAKIKTLVHMLYPQKLSQFEGYNYAYISEWMSHKFSNRKIPFVPLLIENYKTKKNLKKKLSIKKDNTVIGCHGGESSFDLKFVKDSIIKVVNIRRDLVFLFLNIDKFCNHPRIKFLKGTSDEKIKKQFINTCDAMIYARSLGESFGLACGEFAVNNKLIISYKFNRHRSHKYNSSQKLFLEYSSFKSVFKILLNFYRKKKEKKTFNKYKTYEPRKVMFLFKKIFLKKSYKKYFSLIDYISNYMGFINMLYFYLRHKIYNHYYNYFESKIIDFKS